MKLKTYIQQHLDQFEDQRMPRDAEARFSVMLKQELHGKKRPSLIISRYWYIAASIALIISLTAVTVTNFEREKERRALLGQLEHESAGERLEGIYDFFEQDREDERIIQTLMNLLHTDSNVNVKIAAIDALLKYADDQIIRDGLIEALETEDQPLVQIKLIKTLSLLREHRAQESFERLLNDQEIMPLVKNNVTLALATFK
jgi:HEAT repeat protein